LPPLLTKAAAGDAALQQTQWRALLRALASLEHFRKVYGARLEPDAVVPFLVFEPESPRSLRHGAQTVLRYLEAVAGASEGALAQRLTGRLAAELRYTDARIVQQSEFTTFLDHVSEEASKIHDAIDARYFVT